MSTVLQRMAVVQMSGLQGSVLQGASPQALDDSDPEAADIARLAQLMPADETQLLYSICLHGRADLGLAPDEYAALTMVLLRLLAFKPSGASPVAEKKTLKIDTAPALVAPVSTSVRAPAPAPTAVARPSVPMVVAAVPVAPQTTPDGVLPAGQLLAVRDSAGAQGADNFGEGAVEETPAPARGASPPKVVAMPVRQVQESRLDAMAPSAQVLVPSPEGDFWHATVQQLIAQDAINALVRELALQSQLIARDTDQWILRVERESLSQAGVRERLSAALQTAGFGVRLVVEVGRVTDSPGRRNTAASAEKQRAAEQLIMEDPFVQSMVRDFGAKIVPGTLKPL
jgi:DNA polymerase-3 subunit gamma/tau